MAEVQTPAKSKSRRSIEEIKDLVVAILDRVGDLSTSELAAAMDYTKVTVAVNKAIKELMAEGTVVYSDPEHPRSPNQKICLVGDASENTMLHTEEQS